jgi:hypothetical protein
LSKSYATLTIPEKWNWHAEVYAFRRVVLNVDRDERTSPCDTDGKWFNQTLVDEAERRLREKHKSHAAARRKAEGAREGRAFMENWAQTRGYESFEHYRDSERIDYVEACVRVIRSLPGPNIMPRAAGGKVSDPHAVAAALGVKAREYTKEELRAGRIALGLEKPDEQPPAEPETAA